MTIWASKSEFEILFGDDWKVELNEKDSYVEFVIQPNKPVEIEGRELDRYINNFKAMGCEEWSLFYNDVGFGFSVTVSRNALLDDYDS